MTNCITCQYREVASFVAHRITILKHVHLLRGVSTANIYRSRYNIGFFTVGGQTAEFSVGKKKTSFSYPFSHNHGSVENYPK